MKTPAEFCLAIINRGRVLIVDQLIPNHPEAIADITIACAQLHASSQRAIHFQLRDPADGRGVLVMEHGATTFQPMKGR